MKYIITESQYESIFIRRRGKMIWEVVTITHPFTHPCNYKREEYVQSVAHSVCNDVSYYSFMAKENKPFIKEFILKFFRDKLLEHWDDYCGFGWKKKKS